MLLHSLFVSFFLLMTEPSSDTVWQEIHANYQKQDWIDKPSLFAETAVQYFPTTGKVLELGAGHGQDSKFFVTQGYEVVSTDIEISSLIANFSKESQEFREKIVVQPLDLQEKFPFEDNSFDIVYAHLSLHYFDHETTEKIMREIERILKPGGVLAFLTNSVDDPEYNKGEKLEEDFFQIDKVTKRYFSIESARQLARVFHVTLLDNLGETYKDRAKGITHLIRFVGHKPNEVLFRNED